MEEKLESGYQLYIGKDNRSIYKAKKWNNHSNTYTRKWVRNNKNLTNKIRKK